MAQYRIVVKYLIKLAQLEKENFLKVVLLQLPKLPHASSCFLPLAVWDVNRAWIVWKVIRPSSMFISNFVWPAEPRQLGKELLIWIFRFICVHSCFFILLSIVLLVICRRFLLCKCRYSFLDTRNKISKWWLKGSFAIRTETLLACREWQGISLLW